MIKFVITIFILLVVLLSISCPKQQVVSSDQPHLAHLKHRPFLTNADLQERITNTKPGEYAKEPWFFNTEIGVSIYFHEAGDDKGKYIGKLPNGNIDRFHMYKKSYSILDDNYKPDMLNQLFLGVREVIDGEVVKHCIKITPSDQIEILNKVIEMNLLSLKNHDHSELNYDFFEKNVNKEYTNIVISTSYVSDIYPENKPTIDAFVAWFENRFYPLLNKPENKVIAFPSDCPDLPRPEKY